MPPDAVQPVPTAVKETLVAPLVRLAVAVEDVATPGTFRRR